MPQHDITCPSSGQPIDRLTLSVSVARETAPSTAQMYPGEVTCYCVADEASASSFGNAFWCCFLDEV